MKVATYISQGKEKEKILRRKRKRIQKKATMISFVVVVVLA
jgi:hypothetical protein